MSNIIPRIITAVETCREWYHNEYPKADKQEKKKRESSLQKIIVSPFKTFYFSWIQNGLPGHISTCHTPPLTDRGHRDASNHGTPVHGGRGRRARGVQLGGFG